MLASSFLENARPLTESWKCGKRGGTIAVDRFVQMTGEATWATARHWRLHAYDRMTSEWVTIDFPLRLRGYVELP
jgi:hypothetical protein